MCLIQKLNIKLNKKKNENCFLRSYMVTEELKNNKYYLI